MARISRCLLALMGGMLALALWPSQPASAITVELAKKCRQMAMKAHPPQRPGTKPGAGKAQQDYFRKCVANQGKVD